MSTQVQLPALGESVSEGTISRWLKGVGDKVAVDEPLVEVSTDKVDTEIPSPVAGVILEILVAEDEVAAVGAVLAVIGDPSEAADGPTTNPSLSADPAPLSADPAPLQEVPPMPLSPFAQPPSAPAPQATLAPQPPPIPQPIEVPTSVPQAAAAPTGEQGVEVTLPALGESVTEGTVSRWLKSVGEQVAADEPLLEVSTDKVDTEVPSPVAGTLLHIRVREDETASVGAVLAIIGDPDRAAPIPPLPEFAPIPPVSAPAPVPSTPSEPSPVRAGVPQSSPTAETPVSPEPVTAPIGGTHPARAVAPITEGVYVTPLVRRMAAEYGVDLTEVDGTGVGGRVRKQDIVAAAEAKKQTPAVALPPAPDTPAATPAELPAATSVRGTTEAITRMRATIARRMVESLQTSAQLTATVEVDLTRVAKIRAQAKADFLAREGTGLSFLPFICKAVVEALQAYPKINATIDIEAGTVTYPSGEHLGIAVDTEKGLLVPVIPHAGDLSVGGLAKKISDVAARSRENKISPDELSGGTFTVTNYGSAGTLFDTPIINQPQAAILGTGAVVKRPVVVSDQRLGDIVVVRQMMYLSLSYDHRLVDGADAARFLSHVKSRLEEGDFGGEFGL